MGTHIHGDGDWMLGFHSMFMSMGGLSRDGTDVTPEEVFADSTYTRLPHTMDMWMHMLAVMHAVSRDTTLMLHVPFRQSRMSHSNKMGASNGSMNMGGDGETDAMDGMDGTMTMDGHGDMETFAPGDLELKVHSVLVRINQHSIVASLGLRMPTGSINVHMHEDGPEVAHGADMETHMPYAMQAGTGSWGVSPALTYFAVFPELARGGPRTGDLIREQERPGVPTRKPHGRLYLVGISAPQLALGKRPCPL